MGETAASVLSYALGPQLGFSPTADMDGGEQK